MRRVFGPAVAALLGSGCTQLGSPLVPAGPQAARIAAHWWLMFWVCAGVWVVVTLVLVIAAARARVIHEEPGRVIPATAERGMTLIVAGATAITTVILVVLLGVAVTTGRALSAIQHAPDALTIEVTAHRWWWELRYPDPVPANIVVTANELHVPVRRPVHLVLRSQDVIHSFWAPNLNGKRDLIPGHETDLWIQVDDEAAFPGWCAEYCGLQHAHMRFVVIAEPSDRFQGWLATQRQPASLPATPAEERGKQVFLSAQCPFCHTIRGTGAGGETAPDLTHFASRTTIAAGTLPRTAGHLSGWILDPQALKPGSLMPPTSLPTEDVQVLVAYLLSLR